MAPEAVAEAFHAFETGQSTVQPLQAAAVSNQSIQESMRLLLMVRAYQVHPHPGLMLHRICTFASVSLTPGQACAHRSLVLSWGARGPGAEDPGLCLVAGGFIPLMPRVCVSSNHVRITCWSPASGSHDAAVCQDQETGDKQDLN